MLRENESLLKANEKLNHEKEFLLKNKDLADGQIMALTKSSEALQKDLKDKENMVILLLRCFMQQLYTCLKEHIH